MAKENPFGSTKESGADTSMVPESTLIDTKNRLIKSDLERAKLLKQKEALYENFSLFQQKYSELVKEKATLQGEVLKSEEERLNMSKLVIDLQIENTELKERGETGRYDLEARLLTIENDLVEREAEVEKLRERNKELNERERELTEAKKELSIEFISLRENNINLRAELDTHTGKHEEMGAEILSLANSKRVLEREREELQRVVSRLTQERDEIVASYEKAELKLENLSVKYQEVRGENERMKLESIKQDVLLQRHEIEVKEVKTKLEKEYINLNNAREREIRQLREEIERERGEVNVLRTSQEELVEKLNTELVIARRVQERESMARETLEVEKKERERQIESLQQDLQTEADTYRNKLMEYLKEIRSARDLDGGERDNGRERGDERERERERENGKDKESKNNDSSSPSSLSHDTQSTSLPDEERLESIAAQMYDEITLSHASREGELLDTLQREQTRLLSLSHRLKDLQLHYTTLYGFCKDVLPKGVQIPVVAPLDVQREIEAELSTEEIENAKEAKTMRERIEKLQHELSTQKHLCLNQAESFRKAGSQLQKSYSRLHEDYMAVKKEHERCFKSVDHHMLEDQKRGIEKLQTYLEERLAQQISDLKRTGQQASADKEEIMRLRERVRALERENEQLREREGKGEVNAETLRQVRQDYEDQIRLYKERIARLESGISQSGSSPDSNEGMSSSAMRRQMVEFQQNTQRKLERERIELKARATQAEEEVESMGKYIESETIRYRKEIEKLTAAVEYCRSHHR